MIPTDYPDTYLNCRSWGHAWAVKRIDELPRPVQVSITLGCARCTMERRDVRSAEWVLVERAYKYPAGYQVKGTLPRVEASQEVRRRLQRAA